MATMVGAMAEEHSKADPVVELEHYKTKTR